MLALHIFFPGLWDIGIILCYLSNGIQSILIYDTHISDLDLSFNIIGSRGAEAIGNVCIHYFRFPI